MAESMLRAWMYPKRHCVWKVRKWLPQARRKKANLFSCQLENPSQLRSTWISLLSQPIRRRSSWIVFFSWERKPSSTPNQSTGVQTTPVQSDRYMPLEKKESNILSPSIRPILPSAKKLEEQNIRAPQY